MNEVILNGTRGASIHVYEYVVKDPKAIVQIFHGMGEHAKRYDHFAKYLNKYEFSVYIHDHRKHGKSINEDEEVGIFTSNDPWESVINDCDVVNHYIHRENKDAKVIILGHSMGSIIARRYIQKFGDRSEAAIFMGTLPPIGKFQNYVMIGLASVMSIFNKKNNKSYFLSNMLNKGLNEEYEPSVSHFDWLSTDVKQVSKYFNDELCGYTYSTKFYKEFFKGILKCNDKHNILETPEYPILFISGKDDPVGEKGEGVKKVFNVYRSLGFHKTSIELLDGMRHEVLNETKKLTTYKLLIKWMEATLEKI
ncbi:MAG: alpha/beta fold hydrolase [Candidatus Izemoplasma sp.]